jgi:2-polyprenyl-3-methyl-5-hydroxy-6-metoxy-1,4-benzoquinol methylase
MAEFDRFASSYEQVVDGVALAGESAVFFAEQKVEYLQRILGADLQGPVLDFGCGVGLLSDTLSRRVPGIALHGYDISSESIARIPASLAATGRFTDRLDELDDRYRVVVCANVLHHIPPAERHEVLADLVGRLVPGGSLVVFEHNPCNPATRYIVATCPLDEHAVLLSSRTARRLLRRAGLTIHRRDYLSFFPRSLRRLRPVEPFLRRVPMGAQYAVVGRNG